MLAEIREIIEKNLPAQVGNALKERLDQAELDASECRRLAAEKKHIYEELGQLKATVKAFGSLEDRDKAVSEREAAVLKRELAADLNEFKVKAAESAKADLFKLAECVFRNPRLVYSTSETRNVPVSSMGHVAQVSDSSYTTVEEE